MAVYHISEHKLLGFSSKQVSYKINYLHKSLSGKLTSLISTIKWYSNLTSFFSFGVGETKEGTHKCDFTLYWEFYLDFDFAV